MAFSDRPKGKRAEKLLLLKLRSEERFVLSIFRAAAFSHNQDPFETIRLQIVPPDVRRYESPESVRIRQLVQIGS
jgi:hypothetical protein